MAMGKELVCWHQSLEINRMVCSIKDNYIKSGTALFSIDVHIWSCG